MFILTAGIVVIFSINYEKNPVNKYYDKPFLVIGCHSNEGSLNESRILFDKESNYGCLVVQGEATVNFYIIVQKVTYD